MTLPLRTERVDTDFRCSCGLEGTIHHRFTTGMRLAFASSFRCACGKAWETDDGAIPADVRTAFYAANGKWALRVVEAGPQGSRVAVLLRTWLGSSSADAVAALKSGAPIAEGLQAEVQGLADQCAALGAVVDIVRLA